MTTNSTTLGEMICPVVEAYKTKRLTKNEVNSILKGLSDKLDRLSFDSIMECFNTINKLSPKAYYWLKQSSLKTAPELWGSL